MAIIALLLVLIWKHDGCSIHQTSENLHLDIHMTQTDLLRRHLKETFYLCGAQGKRLFQTNHQEIRVHEKRITRGMACNTQPEMEVMVD